MTTPKPAPIVDAHQQFAEGPPRCLPPDLAPLLPEEGVVSTVLVQPLASAEQTDWAVSLAAGTDFVGAVVPWVDVTARSVPETSVDSGSTTVVWAIDDPEQAVAVIRTATRRRGLSILNLSGRAASVCFGTVRLALKFSDSPSQRVEGDPSGPPSVSGRRWVRG